MRRIVLIILVLSSVLLSGGSTVKSETPDNLFKSAGEYYQNKNFEEALWIYKEIEETGARSASLYFNMGNCYFKLSKPGYSILYYLKAQKIDPYDADIETNLEFIQQFMPTRLEGVQINPVNSFMDIMVEPFTLNALAWVSSALFILLLLFWAIRIYMGLGTLFSKSLIAILLILVLFSSGLTTYKYRTGYLTERGVIVADEARVYSGPGEDNDVEFVGGFGLEFEVEKESGDYYLVMFENKRKGWIKKDNAAII